MGFNEKDGRSVTNQFLLQRKKQALSLYAEGVPVMQIVAETGLSYPTVRKTLDLFAQGGEALALTCQRGRQVGCGKRLSPELEDFICRKVVDAVPEALGLSGRLWSREALMSMIARDFEPRLSPRGVDKYMRQWGFHAVAGDRRDCVVCPQPVRQWLECTYPQVHTQSRHDGGKVYWGSLRIWRPCRSQRSRQDRQMPADAFVMLSAVSNRRRLHWLVVPAPLSPEDLIRFMDGLARDTRRKITLIVESRLYPRDSLTQAWLAEHAGRVELVVQPGCELRPPRCALRPGV